MSTSTIDLRQAQEIDIDDDEDIEMSTPPTLPITELYSSENLSDSEEHPHKSYTRKQKEKLPSPSSSTSTSSDSSFRRQAKLWFLTYPQCNINKERMKELYGIRYPNYEWLIIAQENHKDSTGKHLHVLINFKSAINVKSSNYFDFEGHHCHIGTHRNPDGTTAPSFNMKDKINLIKYVIKDGDWICRNIDPEKFLAARKKHQSTKFFDCAEDLRSGMDLVKLRDKHLEIFLRYNSQISDCYYQYRKDKEIKQPTEPFMFKCANSLSCTKKVQNWLNNTIFQKLTFRPKHLFLYGPPQTGKSHLIQSLKDMGLKGYEIPQDGAWWGAWQNDKYDFAYYDEFKGNIPIGILNKFMDGYEMGLKVKNQKVDTVKNQIIPCIFTNNDPPTDLYVGMNISGDTKNSWLSRLEIVHVLEGELVSICK